MKNNEAECRCSQATWAVWERFGVKRNGWICTTCGARRADVATCVQCRQPIRPDALTALVPGGETCCGTDDEVLRMLAGSPSAAVNTVAPFATPRLWFGLNAPMPSFPSFDRRRTPTLEGKPPKPKRQKRLAPATLGRLRVRAIRFEED